MAVWHPIPCFSLRLQVRIIMTAKDYGIYLKTEYLTIRNWLGSCNRPSNSCHKVMTFHHHQSGAKFKSATSGWKAMYPITNLPTQLFEFSLIHYLESGEAKVACVFSPCSTPLYLAQKWKSKILMNCYMVAKKEVHFPSRGGWVLVWLSWIPLLKALIIA